MTKTVIDTVVHEGVQDFNLTSLVVTKTGGISLFQQQDEWAVNVVTTGVDITVNGFLVASSPVSNSDQLWALGINNQQNNTHIVVGSTGLITGDQAIFSSGDFATIENHGRVEGQVYEAILLYGDAATLTNSGTIFGSRGVKVTGAGNTIVNDVGGTITGADGVALSIETATGVATKIVNHGTIVGGIFGDDGAEKLISDGVITGGLIYLRDGNDIVDLRGTKGEQTVYGGLGNDVFMTDNAKVTFSESESEGTDTVKSSVSYTLSNNVETLTLLGKKNINATGSDDTGSDNYLYGNPGDNVLNGKSGYNEMFGRGGTDTLIGGAEYDLFGIGKGYGHDTARGFTNGLDQIDIYLLGPDNFADLQPHIEQHKADTWLVFGKDVLILKNTDHHVLDETDFLFNY